MIENELQMLATHLEHDVSTHKEYYRLPVNYAGYHGQCEDFGVIGIDVNGVTTGENERDDSKCGSSKKQNGTQSSVEQRESDIKCDVSVSRECFLVIRAMPLIPPAELAACTPGPLVDLWLTARFLL
jgi:hypothetical protein